jgi:hypothetical protein
MLLTKVISRNKVTIRLTSERWHHIITSHLEIDSEDYKSVMNTVKNPEIIFKGDQGELLAVKKRSGKKVWIVVAYKELGRIDGFVLTAYLTTDSSWLFQKEIIWNKE